jgi:hypothetical protein
MHQDKLIYALNVLAETPEMIRLEPRQFIKKAAPQIAGPLVNINHCWFLVQLDYQESILEIARPVIGTG